MPLLAIVLGVAGLIPFIVCGLGAVSVDAVSSARMMTALIGYGAVILSFLGGVHWGFALGGFALGGVAAAPPAPVTVAGNRFVTAERAMGKLSSSISTQEVMGTRMARKVVSAVAVCVLGRSPSASNAPSTQRPWNVHDGPPVRVKRTRPSRMK